MNYEVRNRQFNSSLVLALAVDGSDVGATYSNAGLDGGQYVATIKKSGAVFTIKLNKALGRRPLVIVHPVTLDCVVRETLSSSLTEIVLTTYSLAGGAGSGNEDFLVFIFGTEEIVEGGR
jgi:hypothetical protein